MKLSMLLLAMLAGIAGWGFIWGVYELARTIYLIYTAVAQA